MSVGEGDGAAVACRSASSIVVVEDDSEALEDLAELLEFEGFCVIACADAEHALVALASTQDATLVTDIMLPGMDGMTLARQAELSSPDIHVVLMSGAPPPRENDHNPAWAYLQKPINVDDLIGAILRGRQPAS
jgi:two-component system, cell cycle response regulator CpdR